MQTIETASKINRLGFLFMTPPQRWNKENGMSEAMFDPRNALTKTGGEDASAGEDPTPNTTHQNSKMPL
jgi:hypothetical protein